MLHCHKPVLDSGIFTFGKALLSKVPTRHITQSTIQTGGRSLVYSMSKDPASNETSLASNTGASKMPQISGIDQTWDPSRGIRFNGLLREEPLLNRQALSPTQKRCSPSVPMTSLRAPTVSADTSARDYIESDGNQTPAKHNASSTRPGEPNLRDETRLAQSGASGPLGYHIPEARMQELILSSGYWQYNLYEGPHGEKVKIHYCTSVQQTERVAHLFLNQEVVGFDIEWKPQASVSEGIRKNVALIQLASEERIALFHLARFPKGETISDLLAPTLRKVLESSDITKVGVSIKGDCTRLRRFLGLDPRGLLELSHLYKLVKYSNGDVKKINKILVSLAQQVEEHLHLPLWKGEVRNSDWSQELDYDQIRCMFVDYFI